MRKVKVKDYEKMQKHQNYLKSVLPKILPSIKKIQQKLKENEAVNIIASKHLKNREIDRNISYEAILETIKYGKVIEFQGWDVAPEEFNSLMVPSCEPFLNVVLAKKVRNNGCWQNVHVCVNIQGNNVVLKTVYDPKSMHWLWTDNYTKRVFYKYVERKKKRGRLTGYYSS